MLKLLAGAAMAALVGLSAPSGAAMAAAPLEAYGGLPSIESVDISPDGKAIALIATVNDERHIIVRALTGEVLASATIGFRKIRNVAWADANHVIIETSVTSQIDRVTLRGEQWQGVSLNVRTGKLIQFPDRVMDSVLNTLWGTVQPGNPDHGQAVVYTPLYATVAGNAQQKGGHLDLYKINLDSGTASLQQMGDNDTYAYLARPDGTILAKASYRERQESNDAIWTLSLRKSGGWQTVATAADALDTPDLWGVSVDGKSVIIDTWDAKEKLWRPTDVSIADGKVGDYIGPPREQGGIISPDGVVLGFTHDEEFTEYDFVEPHLKALWPAFRGAFKGQQVTLTSWTPDFSKLVLFVSGSSTSGAYYIADTVTKRVDLIGGPYPKVTAPDVATVRAVHYKAADGLDIEGVLTVPKGKAEKDLPLVVFPHGGPRARDGVEFDWWAQAMASRGYAVLQPNFRGSTGYGRPFMTAGYGEWGAKMQTDLSDGVAYLAKAGTIDPKRVCIVGASYGGYAALAGVTVQQGVYRCAVSVAGVSDLKKMLGDDILRYGERNTSIRDLKRLFGVDSPSDPKLEARSPAYQAAKTDAPILLIHGNDDTRVPFVQSQRMASSLKAAGKPYEFVVLGHEDHFLSTSATRKQMLSATVSFIEKYNPPN